MRQCWRPGSQWYLIKSGEEVMITGAGPSVRHSYRHSQFADRSVESFAVASAIESANSSKSQCFPARSLSPAKANPDSRRQLKLKTGDDAELEIPRFRIFDHSPSSRTPELDFDRVDAHSSIAAIGPPSRLNHVRHPAMATGEARYRRHIVGWRCLSSLLRIVVAGFAGTWRRR
jgi:hypothetical protein